LTAPTQTEPDRLTPAQIAALLALVQAQAAVRRRLTDAAKTAALAAIDGFTAWWDADAVTQMIADVLRVVQPLQRQAATITDGYLTRASTIISGRSQQAAGAVDVRALRRAMTEELADEILAGVRQAVRVELGGLSDHPSRDVQESPAWGLEDDRVALDPADPYGRVADGYRWQTTMLGDSPDKAQAKAAVRIGAIAETDVTLAVRAQYQRTMSKQGAIGWRRILHPELSETGPCGLCVVAADRVYKTEDLLPIHNRCVPAGTRVAAEGVRSLTRRRYSGALVVLVTASGQELTITAKHPVLTDRGWVPAHLVEKGDNVVRHRAGHGVVGRGPDEDDMPPLVEDVWRASVVSGSLRRSGMPVAAEDFHGDGSDGEVDAVSTYGLLPNIGDVSFAQPASELSLVVRHRGRMGLSGAGSSLVPGLADRPSTAPFVGGLHLGSALLGRHSGVVTAQRLGDAADRYAGLFEAQADRVAVESIFLGERKFGGTGFVLGDDLGIGSLLTDPPRFDPDGFEFAGEGREAYADLGSRLLERLAGHVELDRVVDYRRVEGTHHVYNLHTDEGWYSAGGLIVSNCVCEVLPVYAGADPGITLNGDDLAALYEAAGGNTREDLRRISVVLTEHGELGPVLVHGEQHYRSPEEVARAYASSRRIREQTILADLEERLDITKLRVERGDPLERTLRSQQRRIAELKASLGVS
jgi:hypothetical protein